MHPFRCKYGPTLETCSKTSSAYRHLFYPRMSKRKEPTGTRPHAKLSCGPRFAEIHFHVSRDLGAKGNNVASSGAPRYGDFDVSRWTFDQALWDSPSIMPVWYVYPLGIKVKHGECDIWSSGWVIVSVSEGRYLAPFMEEIVLSDTMVKLYDTRKGSLTIW